MGSCDKLLNLCATIGQIFLVILNIVTCMLGIGIMAVGIYLQTNDAFLNSDVMTLLMEIDLGGITLGQIIELIIIFIIIIGVFTVLVSGCGGIGGGCKFRVVLIIYIIVLILVLLFETAALGLWIKLVTGINSTIKGLFEKYMKHYNGTSGKDIYSLGWNALFILFECCGVSPVTSGSNDFETLLTNWWSNSARNGDIIPYTCCTESKIINFFNVTNSACTQTLVDYRTSGCYDFFSNMFNRLAGIAITIFVLLLLVEVLAIFASVLVIKQETSTESKRKGKVISATADSKKSTDNIEMQNVVVKTDQPVANDSEEGNTADITRM